MSEITQRLSAALEDRYKVGEQVGQGGMATSGSNEIYVRAFPGEGSGAVRQISSNGGTGPIWSRDGTTLYYNSNAGLVEARLETGRTVNVRARTVLFQTNNFLVNHWHPRYDVLPDGNFVMISLGSSQGSLTTVLVRNWAEEMK